MFFVALVAWTILPTAWWRNKFHWKFSLSSARRLPHHLKTVAARVEVQTARQSY